MAHQDSPGQKQCRKDPDLYLLARLRKVVILCVGLFLVGKRLAMWEMLVFLLRERNNDASLP